MNEIPHKLSALLRLYSTTAPVYVRENEILQVWKLKHCYISNQVGMERCRMKSGHSVYVPTGKSLGRERKRARDTKTQRESERLFGVPPS